MNGILAVAAGQLAALTALTITVLTALTITVLTAAVLYLISEVRHQRTLLAELESTATEWQQAFHLLRDTQQQATAEALDELERHANGKSE